MSTIFEKMLSWTQLKNQKNKSKKFEKVFIKNYQPGKQKSAGIISRKIGNLMYIVKVGNYLNKEHLN